MPDLKPKIITGLLLAAGASRRFGRPKLLAKLDGKALILHSLGALSACDRIVAVVRPEDLELCDLLRNAGIEMVFNSDAALGMGRSIAYGVDSTPLSSGWCIQPADMPAILPATTQSVVDALRSGASLVAPFYEGRRGHPVGFGSDFKHDLIRLSGERGARSVLENYRHKLLRLEVEDAGILRDIDTPDQL